jgi:SAM-dependent methyltransferase
MMSEDSMHYDPRHWHNIQTPEEMDVSRHFEYDDDALLQLKKWLRLEEASIKTIVEIGCGSGYFTEKLMKMAPASNEFIAIEPDDTLREHANEKLSPKVKFLKGTAEDMPLPNEIADLTICHIVLNNLPDVNKAVSEMARVTKCGGIVAAIEPGGGGISYYPDPKLNELEESIEEAYAKAIWDLRNKMMDYSKDLTHKKARYPEVFYSCGLTKVEAHGIFSAFLLSDSRWNPQEVLLWIQRRVMVHENSWDRKKEALRLGGLSEDAMQQYYHTKKAYLEGLIRHPESISKTHEFQAVSRTITIGFKPERRTNETASLELSH